MLKEIIQSPSLPLMSRTYSYHPPSWRQLECFLTAVSTVKVWLKFPRYMCFHDMLNLRRSAADSFIQISIFQYHLASQTVGVGWRLGFSVRSSFQITRSWHHEIIDAIKLWKTVETAGLPARYVDRMARVFNSKLHILTADVKWSKALCSPRETNTRKWWCILRCLVALVKMYDM